MLATYAAFQKSGMLYISHLKLVFHANKVERKQKTWLTIAISAYLFGSTTDNLTVRSMCISLIHFIFHFTKWLIAEKINQGTPPLLYRNSHFKWHSSALFLVRGPKPLTFQLSGLQHKDFLLVCENQGDLGVLSLCNVFCCILQSASFHKNEEQTISGFLKIASGDFYSTQPHQILSPLFSFAGDIAQSIFQ